EVAPPPVPRRVRRGRRGSERRIVDGIGAGREAVRPCLRGVRRRFGGAARGRPPRVRAVAAAPGEGVGVGQAGGFLRPVDAARARSNLGIYATGQSYEQLLMRLAQHPLVEAREYGDLMKVELRKVIPEFLKRVDVDDRGVAWSSYWRDVRERTQELAAKLTGDVEPELREEVNLVDYDPEGELKVTAAALYAASDLPDDQLFQFVCAMLP